MQKSIVVSIIVLVIIIGIGVAFYFFQYKNINHERKEDKDQAQDKKDILEREEFLIEIPKGWQETKGVPGISSAMIAKLDEENQDPAIEKLGFKSYFAVGYEYSRGKSLEEFAQYIKDELKKGETGLKIVAEKPLHINDRSAYLFEGEISRQGADFKAFVTIIKGQGNDMWLITFNTGLEQWQRYKEVFEETINSFVVLKEKPKLKAIILKEGQGRGAKKGDKLSVYYVGRFEDGTQFDAKTEGEPFTFTLGAGQVIAGWDEGLTGMKVGEKRELVVPPHLAYGEEGISGSIPAGATLIFRIELLEIEG